MTSRAEALNTIIHAAEHHADMLESPRAADSIYAAVETIKRPNYETDNS